MFLEESNETFLEEFHQHILGNSSWNYEAFSAGFTGRIMTGITGRITENPLKSLKISLRNPPRNPWKDFLWWNVEKFQEKLLKQFYQEFLDQFQQAFLEVSYLAVITVRITV